MLKKLLLIITRLVRSAERKSSVKAKAQIENTADTSAENASNITSGNSVLQNSGTINGSININESKKNNDDNSLGMIIVASITILAIVTIACITIANMS